MNRNTLLSAITAATSVILMASAPAALAADKFWGNVLGGTFSSDANWQGGSVPSTGDVLAAHDPASTSPVSTAVPEPGALGMLALIAIAAAGRVSRFSSTRF